MRRALIVLPLLVAGCGDPGVPMTHHQWSDTAHEGTAYERCLEREITESEAMELLDRGHPAWWPWPCPEDWLVRCVGPTQTAYAYESLAATWLADVCEPRGEGLTTRWP